MNYFKPSASSLERAVKCRGSSIIPVRCSSENEAAERGTQLHKYIELIISGLDPDAAICRIPDEYKDNCRRTDVSFLVGLSDIQAEVSYAVDFETGQARFLGQGLGRNYPDVKDSEFTGTLDIVAKRGEKPVIIDMKSGMVTTPAKLNYQIKFAACALHSIYGYKEIETRLLYLREGDENFSDCHIYTESQINSAMDEFKEFYKLLLKEAEEFTKYGKLQVHESFHCDYCPAQLSCPAKVAALHRLAEIGSTADLETLPGKIERMTPDTAAKAWINYQNIKNYFDTAGKALRQYAEKNRIVGEGFKVVKMECKTKPKPNVDKLIRLAKKKGASEKEVDSTFEVVKFTKLTTKKLETDKSDKKSEKE